MEGGIGYAEGGIASGSGCRFVDFVAVPATPQVQTRVSRTIEQQLAEDLAKAQQQIAAAVGDYDRWLALTELVLLEAGSEPAIDVQRHVSDLLALSENYRQDWNYGNAVHKANLALGRLALRENDTVRAKEFLLKAGETPGSPQLNSFGPNMLLAKELFAQGERDAILEYLERYRKFWKEHEKLNEWATKVKANVEPTYGPHLRY